MSLQEHDPNITHRSPSPPPSVAPSKEPLEESSSEASALTDLRNTPVLFGSYLKNSYDYNRYFGSFNQRESTLEASNSDAEANLVAKKRRRGYIVKKACVHCRRSHRACDDSRPCKRCVETGRLCEEETTLAELTLPMRSESSTQANSNTSFNNPPSSLVAATVAPPHHNQYSPGPFDLPSYNVPFQPLGFNPHQYHPMHQSYNPPPMFHGSNNEPYVEQCSNEYSMVPCPQQLNQATPPTWSGEVPSYQTSQHPFANNTDINSSDLLNQVRNLQRVVETQNKIISHLQAIQRQYPPTNSCQWIGTPSLMNADKNDNSKWYPESIWCLKTHQLLGCNTAFCDVMGYTMQELAAGAHSAFEFTPERYAKNTPVMCSHLSQTTNKPVEVRTS